jgi:purine nucleosidase
MKRSPTTNEKNSPAGLYIHAIFALVLLVALCLVPAQAADHPRPVIISTDVGCEVDDQIAITHALLSPELKVLGIVTTHAPNLYGNDIPTTDAYGATLKPAHITTFQAHQVLRHLPDRYRCPVSTGSSVPLPDKKTPLNNAGVQFIIDRSKVYAKDNRLTIIALGATTDIASALLIDPTLAERIEIVAMGFDSWPKGGDGFNIRNDVKAWQILMDSDIPISIVDGAVSKKFLCVDQTTAASIFTAHGADGRFLGELVEKWLRRNADFVKKTTGRDAWPIWDEGTIAYLLGYGHAKTYPRPILNDDTTFDHPSTKRTLHWITIIDAKADWKDLDQKLDANDVPLVTTSLDSGLSGWEDKLCSSANN